MKRLLLILFSVFFLISCGSKPEKIVSKFIDNIKEKKIETASKYVTDTDLEDEFKLEYSNKVQQLLFETLFHNINYEITGVERVDKKNVVVTVKIENVDTQKIFLEIFAKMLKNAIGEGKEKISIEDEFQEILSSKDVPKIVSETHFLLVKTKKGYKINLSPDNVDVLFGNLNQTLQNLDTLGDDSQ